MHSLVPLLVFGLTTTVLARTPVISSAAKNVLVLGDSLSAGYGLSRAQAYPALLAHKAEAAGWRVHLINAGVSGGDERRRIAKTASLLREPIDVLVIQLGINDAFRDVPVAQIEANLQKIIDLARARYPRVKIVIVGMQLPRYSQDDYVTRFGAMYPELAARNQAALVPFLLDGVLGNPALNLPDMIHPNARGQEILAANVWPVLESVLRKS